VRILTGVSSDSATEGLLPERYEYSDSRSDYGPQG
jgi:hypothetical protein